MLKHLWRLLMRAISGRGLYGNPCELPDHLSLREWADLPPYHPPTREC